MKKMKKIGALLAAGILSLGVGAFAACGDDNNNDDNGAAKDAYTITVKDANGNAIEGIRIGVCTYDKTTQQKGMCLAPEATDANGKVVFDKNDNVTEGVYALNTDLFSAQYETQETYVFEAYGEYTVILIEK
ncbi:MAG: hypothetical protein E7355_05715 [Clostridiales bacterium]|nr:hypothetical protein [Clostridiales bacterium]